MDSSAQLGAAKSTLDLCIRLLRRQGRYPRLGLWCIIPSTFPAAHELCTHIGEAIESCTPPDMSVSRATKMLANCLMLAEPRQTCCFQLGMASHKPGKKLSHPAGGIPAPALRNAKAERQHSGRSKQRCSNGRPKPLLQQLTLKTKAWQVGEGEARGMCWVQASSLSQEKNCDYYYYF